MVKCFAEGHEHHGCSQDSNPHSDDSAIRTQIRCTKLLDHGTPHLTLSLTAISLIALISPVGEKENKDLITHVQVKHCPRCRTRWEKNGGCLSMICGMCQLNFCWTCLQPFEAHDVNSCRSAHANFEVCFGVDCTAHACQ